MWVVIKWSTMYLFLRGISTPSGENAHRNEPSTVEHSKPPPLVTARRSSVGVKASRASCSRSACFGYSSSYMRTFNACTDLPAASKFAITPVESTPPLQVAQISL